MTMRARLSLFACACVLASACAGSIAAPLSKNDVAERVGFDQHLNATVPLGAHFRDEAGRDMRLADYFDRAPVVLVFAYYGCTALCPTVIADLEAKLDRSGLAPVDRYQVIVASIDASDTPAIASAAKAKYLASAPAPRAARLAEAWHLLTGNPAEIAALTQAAGFRAAYDEGSHQFAHPAGVVVVTPGGVISRYFFGFDYTPSQLREALDEAAAERIASPIERLLLLCFHFDPATGKYSATIIDALRGMALAMLLGYAALLAFRRIRTHRDRTPIPVE